MEKEQLNKLLEAIEGIGYKLVSLKPAEYGGVAMEIIPPVFVGIATGKQVNPSTGEPIPFSQKDLERFNNFWAMVGAPQSL